MLRFTKMTRTIPQGAQFICSVATDDKYKGTLGRTFVTVNPGKEFTFL